MKAFLRKKGIKIIPTPTKNLKDALWIEFETETRLGVKRAYTDIHKGQDFYSYPNDPRKVIKAWIK